jgi:hypothetical protein
LPFLAKNTGPTFDRRGRGDTISARRGAALLKQKLQPSWAVLLSFLPGDDSAHIETGKLSTPGGSTTGKESTGRVYRFMGGAIVRNDSARGGGDCTKQGGAIVRG